MLVEQLPAQLKDFKINSPHFQQYQRKIMILQPIDFVQMSQIFRFQQPQGEFRFNQSVFQPKVSIYKSFSLDSGQIIVLIIKFSYFQVSIRIRNIDGNSNSKNILSFLSHGSHGLIFTAEAGRMPLAIKQIRYYTKQPNSSIKIQQQSIFKIIYQYSIFKVCSKLKIGPFLPRIFGFDLLVFNDCVEFAMELCTQPIKKGGLDLQSSLRTLHSLNIIHGDIKTENIMWSSVYQKLVFVDFGYSACIKEPVGYLTYTSYFGTYPYSCEEMKKCYNDRKANYVDVYYNDLFGLQRSLQELQDKVAEQKTGQIGSKILRQKQSKRIQQIFQQFTFNLQTQFFIPQFQIAPGNIWVHKNLNSKIAISEETQSILDEYFQKYLSIQIFGVFLKSAHAQKESSLSLMVRKLKRKPKWKEKYQQYSVSLSQRIPQKYDSSFEQEQEIISFMKVHYNQDISRCAIAEKEATLNYLNSNRNKLDKKQYWQNFTKYIMNLKTNKLQVQQRLLQALELTATGESDASDWKINEQINPALQLSCKAFIVRQRVLKRFNFDLFQLNQIKQTLTKQVNVYRKQTYKTPIEIYQKLKKFKDLIKTFFSLSFIEGEIKQTIADPSYTEEKLNDVIVRSHQYFYNSCFQKRFARISFFFTQIYSKLHQLQFGQQRQTRIKLLERALEFYVWLSKDLRYQGNLGTFTFVQLLMKKQRGLSQPGQKVLLLFTKKCLVQLFRMCVPDKKFDFVNLSQLLGQGFNQLPSLKFGYSTEQQLAFSNRFGSISASEYSKICFYMMHYFLKSGEGRQMWIQLTQFVSKHYILQLDPHDQKTVLILRIGYLGISLKEKQSNQFDDNDKKILIGYVNKIEEEIDGIKSNGELAHNNQLYFWSRDFLVKFYLKQKNFEKMFELLFVKKEKITYKNQIFSFYMTRRAFSMLQESLPNSSFFTIIPQILKVLRKISVNRTLNICEIATTLAYILHHFNHMSSKMQILFQKEFYCILKLAQTYLRHINSFSKSIFDRKAMRGVLAISELNQNISQAKRFYYLYKCFRAVPIEKKQLQIIELMVRKTKRTNKHQIQQHIRKKLKNILQNRKRYIQTDFLTIDENFLKQHDIVLNSQK